MENRADARQHSWWGHRRHAHARAKKRRWPRRLVAATAIACLLAGVGVFVQIYRYHVHSNRVGEALIRHEQRAMAIAGKSASCVQNTGNSPAAARTVPVPGSGLAATPVSASPSGEPAVYGLLKAPAIGLVAPVVRGTGEADLSVAVGHVTASSWPGAAGTSVLEGHDVTWFSRLGQLGIGAQVILATPCRTFTYRVQANSVVPSGTPVHQTTSARLVLVTCYPLDSLSLTTRRLMVTADLTSVSGGEATAPRSLASSSAPKVPAPAPLAAQGLDLANNPAPMGTLTVEGAPDPKWQQSPQPLADEGAVIALYFAALRSAEQDRPAWWASIAPSVPFRAASALVGADVVHNDSTFNPVLRVTGDSLTGATLATEPELAGGSSPGLYRIMMTAVVGNGQLVVTGWTVTPA
ncbi:MAG: class D sortase [Acidimicrobiales bacterium]